MRNQFLKGALVGGLSGALVMMASGAMAGSGIGAPFNLGKFNTVDAQSSLAGSTAGSQLRVANTSTGATARAISASSAGGGATIRATNSGAGPAASFSVSPGNPPFTVDSSTEVAGLNAEMLQGKTPADFYAAGSTVANSNALGGLSAGSYQQACRHGSVFAFANVQAAANFSATFTQLSHAFNCSGDVVYAKRVATGDYRVLVCGVPLPNNPLEPFALGTDQSFNDFVSVDLVEPPDPDVQATCGSFDTFSEFKVTTRDAAGTAHDNAFLITQL